jgi:hypothetical protein
MKSFRVGLMAAAAAVCFAAPSNAASVNSADVVYQDALVPAGQAIQTPIVGGSIDGLQQWQGNLGMQFQVLNSVSVYALGAFDNGLTSELNGTRGTGIDVGIFNVTSGLLVGTSVHFTTGSAVTQIGGDAFLNVTPFLLGPGSYSIVSLNDPNYNQGYFGGPNIFQTLNNLGGKISFTGPSTFDGGTSLGLPGNTDGPPVDRYDAGTFAATATPLPSTWLMLLSGFVGLGLLAFQGTKKASVAFKSV